MRSGIFRLCGVDAGENSHQRNFKLRKIIVASFALLVLAVIFLQQSSGVAPSQALSAISQWPMEQKFAIAVIGAVLLVVPVAGILQADKLSQQAKAIDTLQRRMSGLRDEAAAAEQNQSSADAAIRHLVGSDPTAAIDDVQQRLAKAEAGASEQQGQNEAIDLQSRIDEIRRRQQALRAQLGSVSEKRRLIEPMLGELKERQAMIERSLAELEKDDSGNSLDTRLKESESFLERGHTRLDALERMFAGLQEIRTRAEQLQVEIAPLKHAETGIKSLFGEVVVLRNQLDAALGALEKDGNESINERMERLAKGKQEIEQRLAGLTECFASLETIRGEIGGHFEKMNAALGDHLKRA
jgi:chromosome segregation ATPase